MSLVARKVSCPPARSREPCCLMQARLDLICCQACLWSVSTLPQQHASKWRAAELCLGACVMQVTGQDHLIFDPLPADVQELSQGDGGISWIVKGRLHAHHIQGLELACSHSCTMSAQRGCLCLPNPPLMHHDSAKGDEVSTCLQVTTMGTTAQISCEQL